MLTLPHPPIEAALERRRRWSQRSLVAETVASLAITAMWVAVAVAASGTPFRVEQRPGGEHHDDSVGCRRRDLRLHRQLGSCEVRLHSPRQTEVARPGSPPAPRRGAP